MVKNFKCGWACEFDKLKAIEFAFCRNLKKEDNKFDKTVFGKLWEFNSVVLFNKLVLWMLTTCQKFDSSTLVDSSQ